MAAAAAAARRQSLSTQHAQRPASKQLIARQHYTLRLPDFNTASELHAVVTTTIRLRFDGHSTAYQKVIKIMLT